MWPAALPGAVVPEALSVPYRLGKSMWLGRRARGRPGRELSVPYRLGKSMWLGTRMTVACCPASFSPLPPGEVDVAWPTAAARPVTRSFSPLPPGEVDVALLVNDVRRSRVLSVPYRLGKSMWP